MAINNTARSEAQIRELMNDWAHAVRSKDVNALMSHYAPDIMVFDLAPPLQYKGAEAYRKNLELWFPTFRGSIGLELRDLNIAASDDIAFCHSFNRITGIRTDDERTDVWARAGSCMSINRCPFTWTVVIKQPSI